MGLKKKKNIIIITICVVVSFILYQLYFFLTITSEAGSVSSIMDLRQFEDFRGKREHFTVKSKSDAFINDSGVIRGVLKAHMSRYRPDSNNEFTCLKTEERIPFDQVNDDYCDCEDGTDEPSTNACVNGTFYCDTQRGNKPISFISIPSSQVNDGVCDCCDGSDEWLHDSKKKLLSQLVVYFGRQYVSECPMKCR